MEWLTSIQTAWGTLLEGLGVLAIIAGGVSAIIKFLSPFKKLRESVKKHDESRPCGRVG